MKRFSLEEYLKNPDRKVVTKSGDEVTIIYTKAIKEWPVVAMINSSIDPGFVWQFSADGESMPDNDGSVYYGGLFFADEELMEFKKLVSACLQKHGMLDCGKANRYAKECAAELLELAKKELKRCDDEIYDSAYADARRDLIFVLPKWRKIPSGAFKQMKILEQAVVRGDYYIKMDDLDKLPKEE